MRGLLLGCAMVSIAAFGCGGGAKTGSVGGTVMYKGQPLTQGEVAFYSQEKGIGATAKIDSTGKYEFAQPLAEGTYAVAVVQTPPDAAAPGTAPKKTTALPKKYQEHSGSGLSCTVKAGANDYPIVLTD